MRRIHERLIVLAFIAAPAAAQEACFVQKVTATDPGDDDRFGQAVAVSGDVAVSGAFLHNEVAASSGSVYVYRFDGSSWVFEDELYAPDGAFGDRFGWAVAADGDRLLVGVREDDDAGAGSGSAWVFRWTGSGWVAEAKLVASDDQGGDEFGTSVALSGDFAVIGADGEDAGGADAGAAYVFERSGTTWTEVQKLVADDADAGAAFGVSVTIDGDVAVVGASLQSEAGLAAGAAYLFRRAVGVWTQEAKLLPNDLIANDRFGHDVAMSGERIAVGAFNGDGLSNATGAVYLFLRVGGSWIQEAKLGAADGTIADFFGWSVAIDGDALAVGAYMEDAPGQNSGAAYLFGREFSGQWTERAKLAGPDTAAADAFGFSVGLSGEHLIVGAWGDDDVEDDSGSAYLFSWEPSIGANYCTGEPNSVGEGATISATGSAVVTANDFTLTARCAPPGMPGVFFLADVVTDVPFGEGRLCATGTVLRLNPPAFLDAAGSATRTVNLGAAPAAGNVVGGSAWSFQFWYRDPAGGPSAFNLTDAVRVDFQ